MAKPSKRLFVKKIVEMSNDFFDGPIDTIIEKLKDIKENGRIPSQSMVPGYVYLFGTNPTTHAINVEVGVRHVNYEDYECYLSYEVPETEEEMNKRLEKNRKEKERKAEAQRKKDAKARELYEQLKKKFGDK